MNSSAFFFAEDPIMDTLSFEMEKLIILEDNDTLFLVKRIKGSNVDNNDKEIEDNKAVIKKEVINENFLPQEELKYFNNSNKANSNFMKKGIRNNGNTCYMFFN